MLISNSNSKLSFIFALLLILIILKSSVQKKARCFMIPDKDSTISGEVKFKQDNEKSPVKISLKIYGAKGKHGFHIHEKGSIEGGCKAAGAHYNPLEQFHGGPNTEERHMGDLGNIVTENGNSIEYSFKNDKITLYGEYSIIGRTCVVHAWEDDLGVNKEDEESRTTGRSGPRLACGIVQDYNPLYSVVFGITVLIIGVGLSFYYFFCYRKGSQLTSEIVEGEVTTS